MKFFGQWPRNGWASSRFSSSSPSSSYSRPTSRGRRGHGGSMKTPPWPRSSGLRSRRTASCPSTTRAISSACRRLARPNSSSNANPSTKSAEFASNKLARGSSPNWGSLIGLASIAISTLKTRIFLTVRFRKWRAARGREIWWLLEVCDHTRSITWSRPNRFQYLKTKSKFNITH